MCNAVAAFLAKRYDGAARQEVASSSRVRDNNKSHHQQCSRDSVKMAILDDSTNDEYMYLATEETPAEKHMVAAAVLVPGKAIILKNVFLNGAELDMQFDSGATCTLVTWKFFQQLLEQGRVTLGNSGRRVTQYLGSEIPIHGFISVSFEWKQYKVSDLMVYVTKEGNINMLGTNILEHVP
jgi:hypothetical protein